MILSLLLPCWHISVRFQGQLTEQFAHIPLCFFVLHQPSLRPPRYVDRSGKKEKIVFSVMHNYRSHFHQLQVTYFDRLKMESTLSVVVDPVCSVDRPLASCNVQLFKATSKELECSESGDLTNFCDSGSHFGSRCISLVVRFCLWLQF